jgi:hypothetical protein
VRALELNRPHGEYTEKEIKESRRLVDRMKEIKKNLGRIRGSSQLFSNTSVAYYDDGMAQDDGPGIQWEDDEDPESLEDAHPQEQARIFEEISRKAGRRQSQRIQKDEVIGKGFFSSNGISETADGSRNDRRFG